MITERTVFIDTAVMVAGMNPPFFVCFVYEPHGSSG
jgi:hypothetical protein